MNAWTTKDKYCDRYFKIGKYPSDFPEYYSLVRSKNSDILKFKSGDYPLLSCDKSTGVFLKDYAQEIKPWARKAIQYYRDQN